MKPRRQQTTTQRQPGKRLVLIFDEERGEVAVRILALMQVYGVAAAIVDTVSVRSGETVLWIAYSS